MEDPVFIHFLINDFTWLIPCSDCFNQLLKSSFLIILTEGYSLLFFGEAKILSYLSTAWIDKNCFISALSLA